MLKDLLGDINCEDFFSKHWNKNHFLWRDTKNVIPNFSKTMFFYLIENCNLDFPRLTCLNNRGQVPVEQYVDITPNSISSKIIATKVKSLAKNGNTIRITGVDQFDSNLRSLRQQLINIFRFNVTINAYYSSSPADGMNPHYDIRHIFIMQLEGSKQWSMGTKINQTPREEFRPFWNNGNYKALDQTLDIFNLNAGEILYIPPGLWHQTKTLEPNYSLHLALGVTTPDWYDVLKVYITHLMKKYPIFREHVPFIVQGDTLSFKKDLNADMLSLMELLKHEISSYEWYKDVKTEI